MKKIMIPVMLLLCVAAASAQSISQQVLATSGNTYEGANYSVHWTLGQPGPVQTTTGSVFYLTQGFQQPGNLNVGLAPFAASLLQLEVYPNPANDFVNVRGMIPFGRMCRYVLTDMNGRVLLTGKIPLGAQQKFEARIELHKLPSGTYVLSLLPGDSGHRPLGSAIISKLVR